MKRCLITHEKLGRGEKVYSLKGLRSLHPKLVHLQEFPYSKPEQLREAQKLAGKMSIQGMQAKLSLRLNLKEEIFEVCERGGTFILKPQSRDYQSLPENEDLTMKLSELAGIEIPWRGLILCEDQSLSYAIKRFDRTPRQGKLAIEDFAQLTGADRFTKYDVPMEKVAEVIEEYCTYPTLEAFKLFRILIFNFLVGNEDHHLKNFSLISRNGKVELSPAYDLLNTTIALAAPQEEIALSIRDKKKGLKKSDFINYFGEEHLFLPFKKMEKETDRLLKLLPNWISIIEESFLPKDLQRQYIELILNRGARLK